MMNKDEIQDLKIRWSTGGFLIFKNCIQREAQLSILEKMRAISGLNDNHAKAIIDGTEPPYVNVGALARDSIFWPLFWNEKVLNTIRSAICDDVCFVGGDSLFIHRSSDQFHRDTFIKHPTKGPVFDPAMEDFVLIRAISYFHEDVANEFKVIPGSHRLIKGESADPEIQDLLDYSITVSIEPGDIVIFDGRLLHAGLEVNKPKYAGVWTYRKRNYHTQISHFYNEVVRTDQTNTPFCEELVAELENHDLYWEELYSDSNRSKFAKIWESMPTGRVFWNPYTEKLY